MNATVLTDRLAHFIAERALPAGHKLPSERTLAAEFGVSRSSLREAIRVLSSQGLLVARHGGGTFVAGQDSAALTDPIAEALLPLAPLARSDAGYWKDVAEIRSSLEGDAAYFAALRANEQDRQRLRQAYLEVSTAPLDDLAAQARTDAAFHLAIAQASRNVVLRQVMSGLLRLLEISIADTLRQLYCLPDIVAALDRQHRQILDAILDGRAEDARSHANAHLEFVQRRLLDLEEAPARARRAASV
ncbi:FCD domain-containing protein [Herbaspirillum rubrisubalbicans]|uniref:FCD domain-containing protein n=1 Tax=Herbaspirillum rubrisubalbicans TaxID=80842 RepID=UPI001D8000D4|nr:FCD domain-containing protein [Herbaspirillum rubrisubalbicans]NQE51821.1 GntR family transcriptional regulator [Herbaspirillum rubrisubalbicans]